MERQDIINYAKILTNIFLIIVISILIFEFYKADKIVKDIAMYDEPESLVNSYEEITGFECLCGANITDRVNEVLNKTCENNYDAPKMQIFDFGSVV